MLTHKLMHSNRTILRVVTAVLTGFCLFTVTEIIWGLLTPGDYFANGSPLVIPSEIVSLILGLYIGFRASGRLRVGIFAVSFACVCYWTFVPEGWWAKAPPTMHH